MTVSSKSDWRNTEAYWRMLSFFVKPHDADHIAGYYMWKESMRERGLDAVNRFITEGLLVPCGLEDALICIATATDLKTVLKRLGLPVTGSKSDLAYRLADLGESTAKEMVAQNRVYVCSPATLAEVKNHVAEQEIAEISARNECREALAKVDIQRAIVIVRNFATTAEQGRYFGHSQIDPLEMTAKYHPEVLDDKSAGELEVLRIETGMALLWDGKPDPKIALSVNQWRYFARSFVVGKEIDSDSICKINFYKGTSIQCKQCKGYGDKEMPFSKVPRFPLKGCDNSQGCGYTIYLKPENEGAEDDDLMIEFDNEDEVDALSKLKRMLEQDLITQQEFDDKKREIISRL